MASSLLIKGGDFNIMQAPDIRICFDIHGTMVTLRTMTAGGKEMEAEFVRQLSEESCFYRFHSVLKELTLEMLERFTTVMYPDNMALIATIQVDGREKQIAVARYAKLLNQRNAAEVAIVVADAWQNHGLGRRMLMEVRNVAVTAGFHDLHMSVLAENHRMIKLAHELGYHTESIGDATTRELGKPI